MNTESIVLENAFLRATVMPSHSGKIASLRYKQNQFELLFQNPKSRFSHAPLLAAELVDCFLVLLASKTP